MRVTSELDLLYEGPSIELIHEVDYKTGHKVFTAADVSSRLFGPSGTTVNNNYKESSRGLVSFSGQAVGPFTINYSSTGSCDFLGWASAAEAAAKAAGIDPSVYTRVNYVTPANSTCGWSGMATDAVCLPKSIITCPWCERPVLKREEGAPPDTH